MSAQPIQTAPSHAPWHNRQLKILYHTLMGQIKAKIEQWPLLCPKHKTKIKKAQFVQVFGMYLFSYTLLMEKPKNFS
jgi:hypothetical protein